MIGENPGSMPFIVYALVTEIAFLCIFVLPNAFMVQVQRCLGLVWLDLLVIAT
jgi:hypothetical protein